MVSSRVEVPEIVRERVRNWHAIERGRVDEVLTLLSDDDWRREHQVDLALSQADLEEVFDDPVVFGGGEVFITNEMVIEKGLLWDVTHSGVIVMFTKGDLFVEGDRLMNEGIDDGSIFVFAIDLVGPEVPLDANSCTT